MNSLNHVLTLLPGLNTSQPMKLRGMEDQAFNAMGLGSLGYLACFCGGFQDKFYRVLGLDNLPTPKAVKLCYRRNPATPFNLRRFNHRPGTAGGT